MAADPEPVNREVLIERVAQLADDHAELVSAVKTLLDNAELLDATGVFVLPLRADQIDTLRRLAGSP